MNDRDVISLYETISNLSGAMLESARNGDWDRLIALEVQYGDRMRVLQDEERAEPADPLRQRQIDLIRKILDDDGNIRSLVASRMTELRTVIDSVGMQRKLSETYGANTGR